MTTDRKKRDRKPFHVVLVSRLKKITPDAKHSHARLVEVAGFIEDGDCPKERHAVRIALVNALARLGSLKSKKWSRADRGAIRAAFDSLDAQDKAEEAKREAHAQSAVTTAAPRGNGHDPAPAATHKPLEHNVGVHS